MALLDDAANRRCLHAALDQYHKPDITRCHGLRIFLLLLLLLLVVVVIVT